MLVRQYKREASMSPNNAALITLGDDFRFVNTSEWIEQYENYEHLMDYVNSNVNSYHTKIEFGTLKDYFRGVSEFHFSESITTPWLKCTA
jgi:hypothetical protein